MSTKLHEAFPRNLRRVRVHRGKSGACLSALCGLSKNMVARYEAGERIPSLATVDALADALGVPVSELTQTERS